MYRPKFIIAYLMLLVFMLMLDSCSEDIATPRPRGYFRIDMPIAKYDSLSNTQNFTFQRNNFTQFKKENRAATNLSYYVLEYPGYKATLYMTYIPVDTNLSYLIKDCHALAYNHTSKADDIIPDAVKIPANKVYGLIYDFKGNAATPLQFYVTDSTDNFLRGSLYFYAKPNYDSVMPVVKYIRTDLVKTLESLKWKTVE